MFVAQNYFSQRSIEMNTGARTNVVRTSKHTRLSEGKAAKENLEPKKERQKWKKESKTPPLCKINHVQILATKTTLLLQTENLHCVL